MPVANSPVLRPHCVYTPPASSSLSFPTPPPSPVTSTSSPQAVFIQKERDRMRMQSLEQLTQSLSEENQTLLQSNKELTEEVERVMKRLQMVMEEKKGVEQQQAASQHETQQCRDNVNKWKRADGIEQCTEVELRQMADIMGESRARVDKELAWRDFCRIFGLSHESSRTNGNITHLGEDHRRLQAETEKIRVELQNTVARYEAQSAQMHEIENALLAEKCEAEKQRAEYTTKLLRLESQLTGSLSDATEAKVLHKNTENRLRDLENEARTLRKQNKEFSDKLLYAIKSTSSNTSQRPIAARPCIPHCTAPVSELAAKRTEPVYFYNIQQESLSAVRTETQATGTTKPPVNITSTEKSSSPMHSSSSPCLVSSLSSSSFNHHFSFAKSSSQRPVSVVHEPENPVVHIPEMESLESLMRDASPSSRTKPEQQQKTATSPLRDRNVSITNFSSYSINQSMQAPHKSVESARSFHRLPSPLHSPASAPSKSKIARPISNSSRVRSRPVVNR